MGFASRIVDNPVAAAPSSSPSASRVVAADGADYGTATSSWVTTRNGARACRRGRSRVDGDRWYGRGTADNKGQHTINFAALERVIEARGRLGFNVKVLLETGEETGSPGLREVCVAERHALSADVLIASDGPRLRASQPTLFLGSRGAFNFDLTVDLRSGRPPFG
jgi:hypothetical protein